MGLPLIVLGVILVLAVGYRLYGGFVARQYALDPDAPTPAARKNDGVDFVPTKPFYLLSQHFSAIAAAGPIAGPILACQQFGWAPCLFWISLGVVFIGAVHDFSTLVASVRHDARSIAEVIKVNLGPTAWLSLMAYIWLALVYVMGSFTSITAQTFVSGDADLKGLGVDFRFNPGGAVAAASIFYLALAVVMGLVDRFLKPRLWIQTLIFVPATLAVVWLGTRVSTWFVAGPDLWVVLILVYCLVGSVTPVWALLQPRGYLGGWVLYMALAVGLIGIFAGGFDVAQPAFTSWRVPGPTGMLFPFLFVTVACGACSGFHGLVCSGTTSKQIARETHCRAVGYGGMLLEGLVAVIALTTIMIAAPAAISGKAPGAVYGDGLGRFLTVIIGKENLVFAITFGAMAFSTFIFDTLDVSTRLGRYILTELFGLKSRAGAAAATAFTCFVPWLIIKLAGASSYFQFWTLFGTSNQLLAALSLLGITVWLKRNGKRYWYTFFPMLFVLSITLWSLVLQLKPLVDVLRGAPITAVGLINGIVSLLLLLLACTLLGQGARAMLKPDRPTPVAQAA
jgi:carbon starvation protein